jgi:hypothetical protein
MVRGVNLEVLFGKVKKRSVYIMKRTALALTLILALFSVMFGVKVVNIAKASLPITSGIKIISPTNATYSPGLLTLKVSVNALVARNINYSMAYSLDGKNNNTIPVAIQTRPKSFIGIITGLVPLPELSEGSHRITVYLKCDYPNNNSFVTPFLGTYPNWRCLPRNLPFFVKRQILI